MKAPCSILVLLGTAMLTPVEAGAETQLPEDYGGFVSVKDGKLQLNGGDFYFSGANSYSMLYSRSEAEEQMRIARELGLNAIRLWGFWDGHEPTLDENGQPSLPAGGTDRYGRPVIQATPRQFNQRGLENLDYVIYLAHLYGLKLVIPLLNEWDEFGGIKQYLTWHDYELPAPVYECGPQGDGLCFYETEEAIKKERFRFFVDCAECRQLYLDYVETILERTNTVTGVTYKDDPAIMIWEVMNEPRFGPWEGDPTATVVRDFIQEAARFLKSIDTNHLVATGEEGFLFSSVSGREGYAWTAAPGEGSSFSLNSAIPEIDVATFHGWPFNWAMATDGYDGRIEEFMPEWITAHAEIARVLGKPVYLGEFGWQILRREGSDLAQRDEIMAAAYEQAIEEDLDGIMYWHITASHDPAQARYTGPIERQTLDSALYFDTPIPHDQEFRFDVYCPEDTSTCEIIRDASTRIVSKVENPDPPFSEPCFAPRELCADSCVLTNSSPTHCGSCGHVCQPGQNCVEGTCRARPAPTWASLESPYDTSGCSMGHPSNKGWWWLVGLTGWLCIQRAMRRRLSSS